MMRSSVDLPQPDGPMSEMNSPAATLEVDVHEGLDAPGGRAARREDLRDAGDLDDAACWVGHDAPNGSGRRSWRRTNASTPTTSR